MFKYSMQLFYSEEDNEYVALIPEFPHLSALVASPDDAVREVRVAAEAFLEDMEDVGQEPPVPHLLESFSGQLRVRMPRSLHRTLAGRARMEGVSLNTMIVTLLALAAGGGGGAPDQVTVELARAGEA